MESFVKKVWLYCAIFCCGYGLGALVTCDWPTLFAVALGGLCFLLMSRTDHDDLRYF